MLSVVGERLPARQLRVAHPQYRSVGNVADQVAWLGPEQNFAALPAQRELDDKVGLSGIVRSDLGICAGVEPNVELHRRDFGRRRCHLARDNAEIDAPGRVALLGNQRMREHVRLRLVKRTGDDHEQVDVAQASFVMVWIESAAVDRVVAGWWTHSGRGVEGAVGDVGAALDQQPDGVGAWPSC
jgi:hypothetical protein